MSKPALAFERWGPARGDPWHVAAITLPAPAGGRVALCGAWYPREGPVRIEMTVGELEVVCAACLEHAGGMGIHLRTRDGRGILRAGRGAIAELVVG